MAKQARAKKQDKLGSGKVTPMQIAFIVDRYLSDNKYFTTLSSFRSEASDLLSRTHGKEVPKGLMGLADILDDYIRLKEQRLVIDREKQRVEAAMQAMQDVIRGYNSEVTDSVSVPIATSPPQIMASPTVQFFCGSNPRNGSHPNQMVHGASISNNSKPPLLPLKTGDSRFSTPTNIQSSTEKRKASKSIAKEPPSPKKLRTQSPSVSYGVQGVGLSSQEPSTSKIEFNVGKHQVALSSDDSSSIHPSVQQGPSVVKKLFKHPEGFQPNTSSPKTPPQALISQMEKALSPLENSAVNTADAGNFQNVTSSSCSLISSETIIISPLKQKGYYAVERSYQVNCSPNKTSVTKLCKKGNVKGRLDFDKADTFDRMEKPFTVDTSTSSPSDAETSVCLDFDLPDFEIFDGDFLSGLLVDICDQKDGFSACHSENTCFIAGPGEFVDDQNLPCYSLSTAVGTSSEGIGLQGYTSNLEEVVTM